VLTIADIMIGIVIGNINRGTVIWLNRASAVNTLLAVNSIFSPSIPIKTARVTNEIKTDETWVKKAGFGE